MRGLSQISYPFFPCGFLGKVFFFWPPWHTFNFHVILFLYFISKDCRDLVVIVTLAHHCTLIVISIVSAFRDMQFNHRWLLTIHCVVFSICTFV